VGLPSGRAPAGRQRGSVGLRPTLRAERPLAVLLRGLGRGRQRDQTRHRYLGRESVSVAPPGLTILCIRFPGPCRSVVRFAHTSRPRPRLTSRRPYGPQRNKRAADLVFGAGGRVSVELCSTLHAERPGAVLLTRMCRSGSVEPVLDLMRRTSGGRSPDGDVWCRPLPQEQAPGLSSGVPPFCERGVCLYRLTAPSAAPEEVAM